MMGRGAFRVSWAFLHYSSRQLVCAIGALTRQKACQSYYFLLTLNSFTVANMSWARLNTCFQAV